MFQFQSPNLPTDTDPFPDLPSFSSVILSIGFWLVVITALIFLTVFLLKKLFPLLPISARNRSLQTVKPIQVILREPISPDKSIGLIRILDQLHVVGITNSQISYLATLDDDEATMIDQWLENEIILEKRLADRVGKFFGKKE